MRGELTLKNVHFVRSVSHAPTTNFFEANFGAWVDRSDEIKQKFWIKNLIFILKILFLSASSTFNKTGYFIDDWGQSGITGTDNFIASQLNFQQLIQCFLDQRLKWQRTKINTETTKRCRYGDMRRINKTVIDLHRKETPQWFSRLSFGGSRRESGCDDVWQVSGAFLQIFMSKLAKMYRSKQKFLHFLLCEKIASEGTREFFA
jgi:hypothetical protein